MSPHEVLFVLLCMYICICKYIPTKPQHQDFVSSTMAAGSALASQG